jgi:2-haloacid dehalogenase
MNRVTLVSFDVFGTLIDVRAGARAAFAEILARSGGAGIDPLAFWEHWEHGNMRRYRETYRPYRAICRDSLVESFGHFGLRAGDPDLIERYFAAFAGFERFPDVDAVLDEVGRGRRLAIVSNIDDDLLAATRLGRRFDLVCTAERARGYKPDGTLFRYLLDQAGCSLAEILHCGQSQHTDLVGGKPLGLRIAWINRRGLARAAGVPAPDHELRDLRGVPALLTSSP